VTPRLALLVVVLCGTRLARAAPCNAPELLSTLPPEGATRVATDATLFAAYASSADYLGEEVLLIEEGGDPRPLPATFDRAQGLLSVKPPDGLVPGARYSVRWPGLRGVDTATAGAGREIRFTAGAGPDLEAPRFDGIGTVGWEHERVRNNCTEEVEDRFVFDLELGAVADDAGTESLALVVFQTAGPLVGAPEPVLTRPLPAGGGSARVGLPVSRAVGRICFAALVRDLTGKVSASVQHEVCVQTTAPPFFAGCAAGGSGARGAWPALLALGWAILRLRPRRRGGRGGS
jgi:hypothetical protein